jgi:hypothetical protein
MGTSTWHGWQTDLSKAGTPISFVIVPDSSKNLPESSNSPTRGEPNTRKKVAPKYRKTPGEAAQFLRETHGKEPTQEQIQSFVEGCEEFARKIEERDRAEKEQNNMP